MSNLWKQFEGLLAPAPLLIGEVTAHRSDGKSEITLPSGETILARGTTVAVGQNAYVRDGLVEGEAPSLPVDTITLY